jgi:hypothetical protein
LRYFIIAVAVLLVAAPAAIGGPDALSIAKRALALAKEPPRLAQVYSEVGHTSGQVRVVVATCPRGMVAINVEPEPSVGEYVGSSVGGRKGQATFVLPEVPLGLGLKLPAINVTCIEGRLR